MPEVWAVWLSADSVHDWVCDNCRGDYTKGGGGEKRKNDALRRGLRWGLGYYGRSRR